jgi:molybdate transport system substrate-binding protein
MRQSKSVLYVLGIFAISAIVISLFVLPQKEPASRQINIAVASNFTDPIKSLVQRFEENTGNKVNFSFGSTGKLYEQIKNGAPFDAFFAADTKHPKLLDEENIALPGSRFTYAVGKIVLWSSKAGFVDENGQVLETDNFLHLAIANPELAPYGEAARAVLQAKGVWDKLQSKIVMGENIAQTLQFIESGNAELGFVALSQLKSLAPSAKGSFWQPPQSLYSPIEQQAVVLKDGETTRAFMDFVHSDTATDIIRSFGYEIP